MKERPILFSAPMVRAILDGSKTQTRRIVKPQPEMVTDRRIEPWSGDPAALMILLEQNKRGCQYGQPGDRLWVRETYGYRGGQMAPNPETALVDYIADGARSTITLSDGDKTPEQRKPREGESRLDYEAYLHRFWQRSIPAIHMPRWASRILLEVTGVRVERLQDISENDAWNEGVQDLMGKESPWKGVCAPVSVHAYATLWEQINGPGSWDANPWVWVIEFKRVDAGAMKQAA